MKMATKDNNSKLAWEIFNLLMVEDKWSKTTEKITS